MTKKDNTQEPIKIVTAESTEEPQEAKIPWSAFAKKAAFTAVVAGVGLAIGYAVFADKDEDETESEDLVSQKDEDTNE